MKKCKINNPLTFFLIALVVICMSTMTMHLDMYAISGWGAEFGRCILKGNIRDLAPSCIESTGVICNYSMLFTIVGGIWEFPVAMFEHFIGNKVDIFFYAIWYKILIVVFFVLTLRELKLICFCDGCLQKNVNLFLALFSISSFVQIPILGMGQVDGISMYCCILAIRMYIEEKKGIVPLLIAFAYLIKPWCLIFYFPLLILYLYRERTKFVNVVGGVMLPLILNLFADIVIMGGYYGEKKEFNKEFFHGFIEVSIRGWSIVLFILFVIFLACIYLCITNQFNFDYAMVCSLAIFIIIFTFFEWHPQYLVYGLPIMVYVIIHLYENGKGIWDKIFVLLILTAVNISFVEIMICSFSVQPVQYGIIGYMFGREYTGHPFIAYAWKYFLYTNEVCITFVTAGLTFILFMFSYLVVAKKKLKIKKIGIFGQLDKEENRDLQRTELLSTICIQINALVILGYFLSSILLFLRNVI